MRLAAEPQCDRQTGQFVSAKETIFQNVFDTIDAKTGAVTYRGDIIEAKVGDWVSACPSTEGGHNWQAMSYHPGSGLLVIPISQSCFEIRGRQVDMKEGSGGTQGDRKTAISTARARRRGRSRQRCRFRTTIQTFAHILVC